nr:MAG TPA: hypothetical protein [Caudoviricetes sp.]
MSFSIVDTRTTLSLYFNWFCEWKARKCYEWNTK